MVFPHNGNRVKQIYCWTMADTKKLIYYKNPSKIRHTVNSALLWRYVPVKSYEWNIVHLHILEAKQKKKKEYQTVDIKLLYDTTLIYNNSQ